MTLIKFQADADLNQAIVTGVLRQQPDISFQTANEAALEGVKDSAVLLLAAKQKRILVTQDRRTMPIEFAEFILQNQSSGVLIISRKTPIKDIIDALLLIWRATTADEWIDRIAKVPL
ncbi:MAG: DUF5615 family PIN-like protein [Phormidesmis sp.]